MLLKGKTAVITGCMQGIGKATLDMFAKEGADIFACCQKESEGFIRHLENLKKEYNVEIIPVYFDLADTDSIKNASKNILQTKKTVDILANIAGITKDALFPMVTREQLQQVFEINFFSQILFTQYIVKIMLKYGSGGSIINTSSISGIDGNRGQLAYGASKAAWVSATKTMAEELGANGIRVNAIAPGVIATAMTENLPEEALNKKISKSNIKRKGTSEEVAGVITYLASDLSSFVTGQIIRVDGGIG